MQTSGGKTAKRGARLARSYFVAAIPLIVMLAPAIAPATESRGPVRTLLCEVRGLANPLLRECREPAPQPSESASAQPTAQPSAQPQIIPSAASSPRAEASGGTGALPPPQSIAPAPSERGDAITVPVAQTDAGQPQTVIEPSADPAPSPLAALEMLFAAALSGGLVWLIAARRRRAADDAAGPAADLNAVRDLLANVKHEVSTPITAILLAVQGLTSSKLRGHERRLMVDSLHDASLQLERTMDLLVSYAALRGGSRTVAREALDPGKIVRAAAAHMTKLHRDRTVTIDADTSLPAVSGDAGLLRAALEELVDNALKFSPSGEPVRITVRGDADGGIQFVVRDHGSGIAPESIDAIFDEFTQGDPSTTRAFGGVGLGLSLAREIARAHGGDVTVRSVVGAGSTFTLRIAPAASKPVAVHSRSSAA